MNKAEKNRIPGIRDFKLNKVRITDAYSINALEKELSYLSALEPDKLLAGFYERAGKKAKAERYLGWEKTEIQGHTLGHYLTALAQAYENTKSEEILERLSYIVSELKNCQSEDGFLFASPEALFDRVENRKPAWVPWYTLHKILAGIISVYEAVKLPEALEVAAKLGDWVYKRTSAWTEELQRTVLSVEYGGMNDVLYDLYKITGKEEHLAAAHSFDELPLFEAMAEGRDILNGKHANTTIPKIIGALNRYTVVGEELYLNAARNFWDIVTQHHSYITGGNSEWEHFGLPDILDKERTNCNCETCNSYNMLKLSKMLFQVTGDRKYADFYEETQINSILSSQNPETGMTTYFQPMATGYFKVYSAPFDKFWCCTGTGMENFTKLNDGIYYHDGGNKLYINRFISSEAEWTEKEVRIIQKADIPARDKVTITFASEKEKPVSIALSIRIPDWIDGEVEAAVNGEPAGAVWEKGYLIIEREWKAGDVVSFQLPMKVRAVSLPDNHSVYAFAYGPVVLSAALGTKDMTVRQTGVAVDIPLKEFSVKDYIVTKGSREEWLANLTENLVKEEGALNFHMKGTDEENNLVFTPHYKQYRERYGIYWKLYGADSQEMEEKLAIEKAKEEFERSVIDRIPLSNDQYELSHNVQGEHTHGGERLGFVGRIIREEGWLSYRMAVDGQVPNVLKVNFHRWDSGRTVNIAIDNELLVKYRIEEEEDDRLVRKDFEIPASFLEGKKEVTVKFQAENPKDAFSMWEFLTVYKK